MRQGKASSQKDDEERRGIGEAKERLQEGAL